MIEGLLRRDDVLMNNSAVSSHIAQGPQNTAEPKLPFHCAPLSHPHASGHSPAHALHPRRHPVAALAVGLVSFAAVQLVVLGAAACISALAGKNENQFLLSKNPLSLSSNSVLLLTVAATIPVFFFAAKIAGYRSNFLLSTAGRVRWDIFGVAAGVTVGVQLITLTFLLATRGGLEFRHPEAKDLWLVFIVLILVPFQAFAAELFARGFLPQIFGHWIRSPWFAYLPGAVLWVAFQPYNSWGLVVAAISAALYATLAHKTGGIEASTAIHMGTNFVAYIQPVFFAVSGPRSMSWEMAILNIITVSLTASATLFLLHRRRLLTQKHTTPEQPTIGYERISNSSSFSLSRTHYSVVA